MSARHPHGYVSALFCAMLLFNLSGCAYIGGAIALAVSGGSSSSRTVGNQAPSVTFMTTPVPQATDLVASVDYDLIDQESGLIDLVVDYSTDGGLTYTPAAEGPGSDGVSDLDSSPTGTPHTYAWNFFSDLFAKDFILLQASSFDVTLRFVSDDGVTRTPMPTDTVSFRVGNRPPTVVLDSVTATPVDPSVEVRFTLLDDFGDPLDLSIEYSLDGFTSPGFPATPLTPPSAGCSDAITGLASSQGGMQHCFEWDYPLDGFSSADGVELRLVVTDPALASSAPVTSAPFRMGNDPPESILSPVDTQFGVSIDFLLVDSTSDTS
ncbi:MAG: hypothetical protein O7H41_06985, partial [Planctomycetota bacterium]|nr:hypothetical protein [Planctomycetota bacterium]